MWKYTAPVVDSINYLLCICILFVLPWLDTQLIVSLLHCDMHTYINPALQATLSVITVFTIVTDTPLFSGPAKRQCAWQSANWFPVTLH